MWQLDEDKKWFLLYFPSSWLVNLGHGMVVTVVGPTQIYLAQNVGVHIDIINLVWSFGFLGYMAGSLPTGYIFRRYLTSNLSKMLFMALSMAITGALMITFPFVSNFPLLVSLRFLQNVALGAFITADTSLVVYTLGPIKSRPFTMALHAVIGIGFLIATFMVQPFLPPGHGDSSSAQDVCNASARSHDSEEPDGSNAVVYEPEYLAGVDKIAWPFLISGCWCIFFSLGYAILGLMPYRLPSYYEDQPSGSGSVASPVTSSVFYWKPLLAVAFFYYFISCGIERIYQPMAFTYGLCGPLKLSPTAAVITDQSYNGGFMSGRISSIFVVNMVKPRNMILISLVMCIVAAAVLVITAGTSVYGLYAGTGFLGFFVSWQFGSCYSWIAQKGDITGSIAPLFLIGCGAGGMVFPFVSGYVFTSAWGPAGILELTLIVCCVQAAIFASMWFISRKRIHDKAEDEGKAVMDLDEGENSAMPKS